MLSHVIQWLDAFGIISSAYLAYYMKFQSSIIWIEYIGVTILGAILYAYVSRKLYKARRSGGLLSIYKRMFYSLIIVINVIFSLLVMTKTAENYSRVWFFYWYIFSIIQLSIYRVVIFKALATIEKSGINYESILIIGRGNMENELLNRLKNSNWHGFKVLDILDLDNQTQIEKYARLPSLDEVWLCAGFQKSALIQNVIDQFKFSTVTIRLIPDLSDMTLLNSGQTTVLGLPALDISVSPMVGFNVFVKWLEDKILSLAIILMISPLLLVIAVAIKMTSEGPIIFRQKRHGWNGKIITVFKFRTMHHHPESDSIIQATVSDPRVTPLGAFLRRTSLDELPQFFNVLLGDMSIVGPRPHAVEHNLEYMGRVNSYMLRHKVKPGITGWAQINGYRGETDTLDKMIKRVEFDLYYIENWSLWFDLSIILRTILTVFFHKNAY